ncbi:hypothetical protein MMC09_006250 [Bachmanniomyces sp. S44760]|nr:hypothetical protein [Bachmanniomyces sp. S44760]
MILDHTARRFTELRQNQPELSDSVLLNSNNRSKFEGEPDVAVIGAGIIGLCYAIHLKRTSPQLKISIFEKSPAPIQKIGESTLSPFSKFASGEMCPHDYFLRLFALKDGLQFYCLDEQDRKVSLSDVGGVDISYQLDRRVSELFFTMWAQKLGINVYHGVECGIELPKGVGQAVTKFDEQGIAVSIHPPHIKLKDPLQSTGTTATSVKAKVVCDASGFSRSLTGKFGNKEKLGSWNCDAYWAYFKRKDTDFNVDDRLLKWDHPATKHMCFPEGWGWFIELISWHQAPLANLMDLLAYIIESAIDGVPADDIPCTQELSETFDCPYERMTSIGWAVRNDFKLFDENIEEYGTSEGERNFNFIKRKYPALQRLTDGGYELLPKYYCVQTYFVKKAMAYRSPVVAGDGWLAIGNSAGFTNPLISPGINAGIGGAFYAATLTENILAAPLADRVRVMQKCARMHQAHMYNFKLPRLHLMNRLWYNSFRDHDLFERLATCFWVLGIDEINEHYDEYNHSIEDVAWNVGAGGEGFKKFSEKVLAILEPADDLVPSVEVIKRVIELSNECLNHRHKLYPNNHWGRYLRQYNDKLQKVPGKCERDKGAKVFAVRCIGCRYWMHNRATFCPMWD